MLLKMIPGQCCQIFWIHQKNFGIFQILRFEFWIFEFYIWQHWVE